MSSPHGAGDAGQRVAAAELDVAARHTAALTQEVQRCGHASMECLKALEGAQNGIHLIDFKSVLLDVLLQPILRASITALARELITANRALSRALSASLGVIDERQPSLAVAVSFLEYIATTLLEALCFARLPSVGSQGDQEFAYLTVCASSAVLLDSGSLVASQTDCPLFHFRPHTLGVRRLLAALIAIAGGQPSALKALRATACSPKAILACVRGLFLKDWGGETGTPDFDGGSCSAVVMLFCDAPSPLFEPERTAIWADAQLMTAIVARAAADLRGFRVIGSGGGGWPGTEVYNNGAMAMTLLASDEKGALTNAAAYHDPGFLDDLIASTELFLRLEPPDALGPERYRVKREALADAIVTMRWVSYPSAHTPPRVLAFKNTLRCLGLAAAAGIHVLSAERGDVGSLPLAQAAAGLSSLLLSITEHSLLPNGSLPPGTDAGSWAAHYQALEGMMRLAALMPGCVPVPPRICPDGGDELAQSIVWQLRTVFLAICNHITGAPDEQEAWTSLVGLVGSAIKFSLRAAGPGVEAFSEEKVNCLIVMVSLVSSIFNTLAEKDEGFPMRQLQGLALSTWAAIGSTRAHPTAAQACTVLLSCFLQTPSVAELALATAAGRSVLLQAYQRLLQEEVHTAFGVYVIHRLWECIAHVAHAGSGEALRLLARAGVLALLVRWAAENCSLPHPQGLDSPVLLLDQRLELSRSLVMLAVAASGIESVETVLNGNYGDFGEGDICSPAFWERLRVEVVEPLVLGLEEQAAAEEGDAAWQAQLAVDVAEALATRPCAHACCTSIVGPSEAGAPRGKLCSGCCLVRYCGPGCQKADWPAHKAACRELARRRAA